jgi:putative ATP-dependent endonuclease of the OLD family
MKLRKIKVENIRSFLEPVELLVEGDISIIIGPNGGGKTNLLDTISTAIRKHLLVSWVSIKTPISHEPNRHDLRVNETLGQSNLEPHNLGVGKQQLIEIELEVTENDIENINDIKKFKLQNYDLIFKKYGHLSTINFDDWDVESICKGKKFNFVILNNSIQANNEEGAELYRQYLYHYEFINTLRNEIGEVPLSTPMVLMPTNRVVNNFQQSISLASHNESDYKRSTDAATSRAPGALFTHAIGRLARKFRLLLEEDSGNARSKFNNDPQICSLNKILEKLGYTWTLESIDPLTNQYNVRLDKQGSSFLLNFASSGEKEILIYLFAIYGLNIRDALILVDEPELHLHPKWQRMLLEIFEELSKETNNQFLLTTHSPVFISPSSIQYVSRVYIENQISKIVRLQNKLLPESKHLFSIVNS